MPGKQIRIDEDLYEKLRKKFINAGAAPENIERSMGVHVNDLLWNIVGGRKVELSQKEKDDIDRILQMLRDGKSIMVKLPDGKVVPLLSQLNGDKHLLKEK